MRQLTIDLKRNSDENHYRGLGIFDKIIVKNCFILDDKNLGSLLRGVLRPQVHKYGKIILKPYGR